MCVRGGGVGGDTVDQGSGGGRGGHFPVSYLKQVCENRENC